MKINSAVVAVLSMLFGLLAFAFPAQAAPNNCKPNYVIVANGVGGVGVAAAASNQYRNRSDTEVRDMPLNLAVSDVFDSETRKGTDEIKGTVNQILRDCSGSSIYLLGHSLGSLEIGDALEELNAEGKNMRNISADLLADPRHPVTGVELQFPNIIPGFTMQGPRASFGAAKVRQTCRVFDGVCDFDGPFIDQARGFFGYLSGTHANYPLPTSRPASSQAILIP